MDGAEASRLFAWHPWAISQGVAILQQLWSYQRPSGLPRGGAVGTLCPGGNSRKNCWLVRFCTIRSRNCLALDCLSTITGNTKDPTTTSFVIVFAIMASLGLLMLLLIHGGEEGERWVIHFKII